MVFGERIGWGRDLVARYIMLLEKVVTQVLALAREHQKERVTKNVTAVIFNFTEGWFRNSGLCDLCEKYQWANNDSKTCRCRVP